MSRKSKADLVQEVKDLKQVIHDQEQEFIPRDRQVRINKYTVSEPNNVIAQQLVDHSVAYFHMFSSQVNADRSLHELGLSDFLNTHAIEFKFGDSWTLFPDRTGAKHFVFAWSCSIVKGKRDLKTIYLDLSFLTRYEELLSKRDTTHVQEEKNRIEILIALKILHEAGHIGVRCGLKDPLKQHKTSPESEAGGWLDRRVIGGTVGIIFSPSLHWTGKNQQLTDLCVSTTSGIRAVAPDFFRRAQNALQSNDRTRLFPIELVPELFHGTKRKHAMTSKGEVVGPQEPVSHLDLGFGLSGPGRLPHAHFLLAPCGLHLKRTLN